MDISFDCCPVTKKEVFDAINRLIEYFQNNKNDKNYFGLDDLGIIDTYISFN